MRRPESQVFIAVTIVVFLLARPTSCIPGCYSGNKVAFTQFWIPREGSQDLDDNGNTILLSGPHDAVITADDGSVLERTDSNTLAKCLEEGCCFLRNGDLVNAGSSDGAFEVIDSNQFPFGEGSHGKGLEPFVSVASNDLPQGFELFVHELEGFELPNGKIHNGCLRVDDQFGEDTSCHIDWFVGEFDKATVVNKRLPSAVHTEVDGTCQILTYV